MCVTKLTVFILSVLAITINAQCSKEDLRQRLSVCSDTASNIINSVECSDLDPEIMSVFECFAGCNQDDIPQDFVNDLEIVKESINKAFKARCVKPSGPSDARDGAPASACGPIEIVNCVTSLTQVSGIPTNTDFNNLDGICSTINTVTGSLDSCAGVAIDCLGLVGNTFQSQLEQIQRGLDIGNELADGGCECAAELEKSANAFASLPQDTAALKLICGTVQSTSQGVRAILDSCINRLQTGAGGTTMDWLSMTINYIEVANPYVGLVCGTPGIITGNSAVTVNLGLLTLLAAGLLHFVCLRILW